VNGAGPNAHSGPSGEWWRCLDPFRSGVDSDVTCLLTGTVFLSLMTLFSHDLLVPFFPCDFLQTSNSGPNTLSYCSVTVSSDW
jgi:hypothetical protein